ncbi:hypothetical protein BDN72DRAFT_377372 [Pluteus cervinus]|uniref:Uncharacterized protein n=1 Tax=Pluteus cervinus TaxID=181527 RepID=A0ACD3ACX2_9AGAR|nr:hypothetical protein BDN72DRAFT_377372 [Pluteus cervinus]
MMCKVEDKEGDAMWSGADNPVKPVNATSNSRRVITPPSRHCLRVLPLNASTTPPFQSKPSPSQLNPSTACATFFTNASNFSVSRSPPTPPPLSQQAQKYVLRF